jgi:predicted transglutaminase-like cysteine proteinase
MTPEQQAQLTNINTEVNAIPFDATPGVGEPPDWWTDQPMVGNSWVCRDYVQMKADKLKIVGWAPTFLTTILCYVETGEYHAVLGVLVDDETWILDSRYDAPYLMSNPPPGYRWDRRQVAGTTEFQPVA